MKLKPLEYIAVQVNFDDSNDMLFFGEKSDEYAEFICLAVNLHDELVEVCELLQNLFPEDDMSQMDASDFKDRAGQTMGIVCKAKALIAKAEGGLG
jgi:hypothetical protein